MPEGSRETELGDTRTVRRSGPAPSLTAAAVVSVLFLWGAIRIQTYVTAQDPFWYIALARQFLGLIELEGAYSMGIQFVSPGFPLLLALTIKLFGPFGPHGLNTLLGIGFFFSFAHLAYRLSNTPWRTAIILLVTFLVIVAGYELNLHFLVYPFRGMAVYFFLVAGMAAVEICIRRDFPSAAFAAAGAFFAAAIAIREPAVFGVVGTFLYIAWEGGLRTSRTWRRLSALVAPTVLCLGAFTIHGATQGRLVNNQLAAFSHYLLNTAGTDLPQTIAAGIRIQAGYLVEEFTWAGIVGILVGVWASRRNKAALCFFLVPATLFFFFYSLYISHYRYVLSVIVFLCPLLGIGILAMLSGWELAIAKILPRAQRLLSPTVAILLVIVCIAEIRELTPWGRQVSRSDVADFLSELEAAIPEKNAGVTLPAACRYLEDALLSFSAVKILEPADMRAALAAGNPCYFLEPLNERSFYEGYSTASLDSAGVLEESVIRFYLQLPPPENSGEVRRIKFAEGEFAARPIELWSHDTIIEKIHVPPHRNMVLWLDFGERKTSAGVHAILQDAAGKEQHRWDPFPGRHLVGLALPARAAVTPHLTLHLESNEPMPLHPLVGWQIGELPMKFPFNNKRSLSTHYWIHPPFQPARIQDRYAAVLEERGTLEIPLPRGGGFETIEMVFVLSPASKSTGTQRIAYNIGDLEEVRDFDSSQPLSYHSIRIATRPLDDLIKIELSRIAGENAESHSAVRIEQINIQAADWSNE
jgi:hypothetical protein